MAVAKLARVVGIQAANPEPNRDADVTRDAFSDVGAYRIWLDDKARVDTGSTGSTGTIPPTSSMPPDRSVSTASPTISVIVPVFRPERWYLQRCIESVRAQTYQRWELCLCDDASGSEEISTHLKEAAAADARVKVAVHDSNGGISRASNTALALAGGDFIALLDHDDELTIDALELIAQCASDKPDADVIYSDEDKLDQDGERGFPQFKPDWSPDLLLSYPYLGHLTVVRRRLVEEIGGFRPEMDGSQDYDLMLRATERARAIVHIPQVLYHWRVVEGSAAGDPAAKPWAYDASRRALTDTLTRRKIDGHVEPGPFPGSYHTRRRVSGSPKVSIIIPVRDEAPILRECVDSLDRDPGHENFEIVLVDNDGVGPETRALIDILLERPKIRLLEHPGRFNWSSINNAAAHSCDADLLLFLDDRVTAKGGGWIGALIEQAQRPEVGVVGSRLLYPDGSLEHCGLVLGMDGLAGHLLSRLPGAYAGYMGWAGVVKECSGVSGACMMSRRELFEELGGFDETFAVEFGDVDFCLRLRRAGYRVIFTPHAELVIHESQAERTQALTCDNQAFLHAWGDEIRSGDPFYNENLSRLRTDCSLRPVDEDRRLESMLARLASPSKV